MGKVGDLSKLHEKYFDQGFRVIGVSSENAGKLEKMREDRDAKFWIGIDPADKTSRHFTTGGGTAIPKYYLVNAHGIVVAEGIPDEEELKELLAERFDPALGRETHPELAAARSMYEAGVYGAAWRSAKKATGDKDEAVVSDARFLCDRIQRASDFWKGLAVAEMKNSTPSHCYGRLLILQHRFQGADLGKWARKELGKLGRDKTVKAEKKAWREFEKGFKQELKAEGREFYLKNAKKTYEKVIASYPRAEAAKLAEKRIAKLDRASAANASSDEKK